MTIIKAAAMTVSVLVTGTGIAQANDWTTVRIATEGAYHPFNAVDASGKLIGFDVDIAEEICKRIKAKCDIVAQDWDGIIPALLAGKYDVIVASMAITEDRKKIVNFSNPYYKGALSYVTPKGTGITDFSDAGLTGKVIGVQAGTTQSDYAEAVHPKAEIRKYRSQDEVNLDLINGRIDLQVSDLLPMLNWVEKTEDGKCCELAGEAITDPAYAGAGAGFAFRKENDGLRDKFNKALAGILADGTYAKINAKYFSVNIYTMK